MLSAAVGNGVKLLGPCSRLSLLVGAGIRITFPVTLAACVVCDTLGHSLGKKGSDINQAIVPVGGIVKAKIKQVLIKSCNRLSPAGNCKVCLLIDISNLIRRATF